MSPAIVGFAGEAARAAIRDGLRAAPRIALHMAWRVVAILALLGLTAVARADDCTVAANALGFSNYDTVSNDPGTTSITVTCSRTANGSATFNFTLRLSRGTGATFATRSMTALFGTETLSYNLYTSPAYTSIWGDGTGGSVSVSGSVTVPGRSTNSVTIPVYGLIPSGQNVGTGWYITGTPITVTMSGVTSSANTDTFYVYTFIADQCSVSAPNLAFGTVNPTSSQTDASMALSVSCTKGTTYTVGLSAGTTAGATIAQRLMTSGTGTMQYNLYSNSTRTSVWGNSSGSWVSGTGTGLALGQSLTVYGRVAGGQTGLDVGNYQEGAITVTVTY